MENGRSPQPLAKQTKVNARTRTTKGADFRTAGLTMAFKLITMAERCWRKINVPYLFLLIQTGAKFPDDKTHILPDLPSDSGINLSMDVTQELAIHNV